MHLKGIGCIHESAPLPLSPAKWIRSTHTLASCFFNANFDIILPSARRSWCGIFLSDYQTKISNQTKIGFYLSTFVLHCVPLLDHVSCFHPPSISGRMLQDCLNWMFHYRIILWSSLAYDPWKFTGINFCFPLIVIQFLLQHYLCSHNERTKFIKFPYEVNVKTSSPRNTPTQNRRPDLRLQIPAKRRLRQTPL
jgi:hypothetical protein